MSLEIVGKDLPDPAIFEHEILHFLKSFHFRGTILSLEHISAISRYYSRLPYENISKIIKQGRTIGQTLFRLPDELTEDYFAWRLGGTCFSLTYFLTGIYTILGYKTRPIICDLNWGKNNHSAVIVSLADNHYLIDPGYMIFTPLQLQKKTVRQQISAETGVEIRFSQETEQYAIYTFRKGQFTRRYQFKDRSVPYSEFARHWKTSFELPGMNDLTLTRVQAYEMTYIQGDFIKITSPVQIEKRRDKNQAERLIRDRFGISLEKIEEARHLLSRRLPR